MANPKWVTWVWDGSTLKDGLGQAIELKQERPLGEGTLRYYESKGALLVAFFTANPSRYKYSVKLQKPGIYRLGEEYGHRVMDPQEEKDPIKRVFRELDIPCSARVMQVVPASDLAQQGELLEEGRREGQYACPGVGLFKRGEHGGIAESWVFEGCDPATLKGALLNLLYGEDTDEEFLGILRVRDLSKAQVWLEKHFAIEPVPKHGDQLVWRRKFEGEDLGTIENVLHLRGDSKHQSVISGNQVFVALVSRYGFKVLEPFMSDDGKAWVQALASLDKAVSYVTSRYEVAFVDGFPGFPIRVKTLAQEAFTPLGDARFENHGELAPLFHHNGLPRKLGKERTTAHHKVWVYDEKIVVSAKDAGKKILFTQGGGITLEGKASDYSQVPLAGLACWNARSPKCKEVILTPSCKVIASVEGDFFYDSANARLLVKESYQGSHLKLLSWEDGKYSVLCLERGEGGFWIPKDPGVKFELFLLDRRCFRLVYDKEGMVLPGHPLLVVSSPSV